MRGKAAQVGDTYVASNGYHYTKTKDGWRLTHHIVAETALGRPINTTLETVRFKDGDKTNFKPDNLVVQPKTQRTADKQMARLIAQRAEADARIALLQKASEARASS